MSADQVAPSAFASTVVGLHAIGEAVAEVRALDQQMWWDLGEHLTCREVEVVCGLLITLGLLDAAGHLFDGHAEADGDDDQHHAGDRLPIPSADCPGVHPDGYECEEPRGHDGPHHAVNKTVAWF